MALAEERKLIFKGKGMAYSVFPGDDVEFRHGGGGGSGSWAGSWMAGTVSAPGTSMIAGSARPNSLRIVLPSDLWPSARVN